MCAEVKISVWYSPERNAAWSPLPVMVCATSSAQSLSFVNTIACGRGARSDNAPMSRTACSQARACPQAKRRGRSHLVESNPVQEAQERSEAQRLHAAASLREGRGPWCRHSHVTRTQVRRIMKRP